MRAARALLGLDQRRLAALSGLSVPTIQRMEASAGVVRGTVDSLTKLVRALETSGVELVGEGAPSAGQGRGVRLSARENPAEPPEPPRERAAAGATTAPTTRAGNDARDDARDGARDGAKDGAGDDAGGHL